VKVIDSFMMNDELDLLTCRLVEIGDAVDYVIAVEADIDHQDHPKPFYLTENLDRFAEWSDKLIVVRATGLPTHADDPDPWAREHAQREFVAEGLRQIGIEDSDVILHGDLDEIPTAVCARNVRPSGLVAFDMSLLCFAVDWLHPERWRGTVAARVGQVRSFGQMRDARNVAPCLPNAGWHLSWLGGKDAQLHKLDAFCHPEIAGRCRDGIEADIWLSEGWHVDGKKLTPVDVDRSWPKWIAEGRCPASWFRPRHGESRAEWRPPTGLEAYA